MVQYSCDKMKTSLLLLPLFIALLSATSPLPSADALNVKGRLVKSKTFLSPPIFLRPGDVADKIYYDIAFPRGHLAFKSFNGEVVDEHGVPVPLHETYLHHWVVEPYYAAKDDDASSTAAAEGRRPRMIPARNSGVCNHTLGQYYGLGSETRRTATWVPDPYGIEIGDPDAAPEGYEERWMLNVHAIDTRRVVDKLACTECRCDLYNVTVDQYGRGIEDGYAGGLRCCYDETRCALEEGPGGFVANAAADEEAPPRKVFLRYTVMWQDWSDAAVLPVKIYIFDVTACKVEYDVDECAAGNGGGGGECVHVQTATQVLPRGGDVVFGVAHQHSGGIAASLHGEDGRLLCESTATYGDGEEAGNEAGYIVGMSTCYPKPGDVKVRDGEALTVVSRYSSERRHTGVMGLFYILVAEQQVPADGKPPGLCFSFPVSCEQKLLRSETPQFSRH